VDTTARIASGVRGSPSRIWYPTFVPPAASSAEPVFFSTQADFYLTFSFVDIYSYSLLRQSSEYQEISNQDEFVK